ncbi:MAG TPA: uroporphyrinogen decarboxylase family protein [Anaerolineae bacterium]
MKPRDWGLAALRREDLGVYRPPTFELTMELTEELLGRRWITLEDLEAVSGDARRRLIAERAETYLMAAERLEYSFIRVRWFPTLEDELECIAALRQLGGEDYVLTAEADNTFRIPDGAGLVNFVYDLYDRPDDVLAYADRWCQEGIERGKRLIDAGVEALTLCADYFFNNGPFLSPPLWERFIGQFYDREVRAFKDYGAWVIKHTDGNIMPLLDRLVAPGIDALQSIDPIAGVDIAEVKRRVGDKICLIGNVDLSKVQQGPREDICASARYCLEQASPGGGYIYGSCNSIFQGVPLDNYLYMLDIWRAWGASPLEH